MPAPPLTNPPRNITSIRPDTDLPLGEVIPGSRYRVIAGIGKGGMGAVYEAEHVDLQKRVALKVLLSSAARDPKRVAGFLHEARTASRIGSPHIADVTDFGELPDGRVYFVMEYLEGHSLGDLLRRGEVFDAARAIPILRQVAKALGATHEKGVIHLDVKPDNVMLVRGSRRADLVKVVDFGIAGFLDDVRPGAKTICGTPEYVSPERITAKGYDHRADVYGLGVLAYEVLTGSAPFRGADALETLRQHVERAVEPMASCTAGRKIPAALEAVVFRMLAKAPDARPSSMAEVEGLLCEAQIASGLKTAWDDLELPAVDPAWRVRLAERMPSPASRRRRLIFGSTAAVAVAAGALSLYLGVIRQPQVVYEPVRVEVTGTDEAPAVAAHIVKANQAVKRLQYVTPLGASALDFIEGAESEAAALGRRSPGARLLRENYAAALQAMGQELEQVDLPHLALIKYRDALRFLPDDPTLQSKAELSAEDLAAFGNRVLWQQHQSDSEAQRRIAADLFVAARRGRVSEARLAMKALAKVDTAGEEAAQLADGLRRLADASWKEGAKESARPLYQVIAGLDPADRAAVQRSEGAAPVAPAPAAKPPERTGAAPRGAAPAPTPPGERAVSLTEAPRDPEAAIASTRAGYAFLASMRLDAAEQAFSQAVALDHTNARAVTGLAEVSFERARYEDALQYARRAARLAPNSPDARRVMGDAYFKLLRYRDALGEYRAAAQLAPHDEGIAGRVRQAETKALE
ncbi:MAG: protein kinase [Myxococcales bacterium]|nr:protein kinase [Myxococcales bacterium]